MSAQLQISCNKDTITLGENAVITLSGQVQDATDFATLPESDGFAIVSTSNNYSYAGGSGKVNLSQTFEIQPSRTGTFTIGPAYVQSGTQRIFSNSLTLTVSTTGTVKITRDTKVFLRCEPDKRTVKVGEQIGLTIRIYGIPGTTYYSSDRPIAQSFVGFYYNNAPYPIDFSYPDTTIIVNGVTYVGKVIYREFVFANSTGKIPLPIYTFPCTVKTVAFPTGDEIVDDLNSTETTVELQSQPVSVNSVKVPDEGKPAGFSGDVGEFTLKASLDKNTVKADEPVTLTVIVSGSGNVNLVQLPKLNCPSDFDVFPADAYDTLTTTSAGVSGFKKFTFNFIPHKAGDFHLEPVSFSYWDPADQKYHTVQSSSFDLHVDAAAQGNAALKSNLPDSFPGEHESTSYFETALWIIIPMVIVILTVLLIYLQKKKKQGELLRKEKIASGKSAEPPIPVYTGPLPVDHMQSADQYLSYGNPQRCIIELYEAVLLGVCLRCELQREESSPSNIRYRLGLKKFQPEMCERTIVLINDLSLKRYSRRLIPSAELRDIIMNCQKILLELGF
ncbi:MAG: protein BatD [Bacteroidetes bacterium]|nr:protein BatD [Bacteroidota bacterium]